MICVGIDGGSRAVKIALVDCVTSDVLATGVADQGVRHDAIATDLLSMLLADADQSREDISYTVATGYARNLVSFADTTVTEITCHAVGVRHVVPDAATVIEIGGQDSKFLSLASDGSVQDFSMNDRCAAGTGRFLEVVASRLDTSLEALGELVAGSQEPAAISSTCVVFAETEIIGLLAQGIKPEDVVAGVQRSIASRIASLAGRRTASPVVFTGGVALIPGMSTALAEVIECPVAVAPDPQLTGALGAALIARRKSGQA